MKILLAITTFNEINITEKCIEKIQHLKNIYPILIDDFSNRDNLKLLSMKFKIPIIGKVKHYGLTHSWNLAYKYFIENDYDFLYISNNDVLIPEQTINLLSESLINSDCYVVVPCSTVKGAGIGKCGIAQGIKNLKPVSNIDVNKPENYQEVQNLLIKYQLFKNVKENFFNGFFFGFRKNISKFELENNNLFNPKLINLTNEIDLYTRIKKTDSKKILYVKTAFIFHYKGYTLDINSRRDNLNLVRKKYL